MEKTILGGKCIANGFSIAVGMTRKEMQEKYECDVAYKLFDFADSDGDGTLTSHEYNRFVCCNGLYPGVKKDDIASYSNQAFEDADINNDNEISLEEANAYTETNVEFELMKQDYRYKNDAIPHRDKGADILLAGTALTAAGLGTYLQIYSKKVLAKPVDYLRASKTHIKLDKFLRNPMNIKGMNIFTKIGTGFAILACGMALTDLIMAQKEDKQRQELKNEYADKVSDFINNNPNLTSAQEFFNKIKQ